MMKLFVLCLFLINLLIKCTFEMGVDNNKFISYQVHSFNDIREWNQLFQKSINWMKIDVNYLPFDLCKLQQRVDRGDRRGCFILNHDSPNASMRYNYNSTIDLLEMFSNPSRYQNILGRYKSLQRKLYVALCFKFDDQYGNVCSESGFGNNWRNLASEFLGEMVHYIDINDQNVEIVLDGVATPGGRKPRSCLDNMWRPLNSTFIISSDPIEGMESNLSPFDRFQIMNIPEKMLIPVQELKYGKFKDSTRYPVLLWEPSDQESIVESSEYFLKLAPVKVGLHFAINIDPVQFNVYSASSQESNGYAWNIFLNDTKTVEEFKITSLPSTFDKSEIFLLLTRNEEKLSVMMMKGDQDFGKFDTSFGSAKLDHCPYVSANTKIVYFEVDGSSGHNILYVGISNGFMCSYKIDCSSVSCNIEFYNSYIFGNSSKYEYYSVGTTGKAFFFTRRSLDCELEIGGTWDWHGVEELESLCLMPNRMHYDESVGFVEHVSTVTSILRNETIVLYQESESTIIVPILLVIKDNKFEVVAWNKGMEMDIGTNFEISLLADVSNKREIVLETHMNGYSYNNEVNNKRADIGVCDLLPSSMEGVMVANFGDFEVFRQSIIDGKRLNSCTYYENKWFLHSMYDIGSKASTNTLYRCSNKNNQGVCLVEVHFGANNECSVCGNAYLFDGLVLDSWRV